MVPTQTFPDFPEFSNSGTKTKPDAEKYSAGFISGDVLPAEWQNWFLSGATAGVTLLNEGVESLEQEINSVLTDRGITPSAQAVDQLKTALISYMQEAINKSTKMVSCSTAVGTAAKTVTVNGYTPVAGTYLGVNFSLGNSATSPTLSVNGGTAYPIKYYDRSGTLQVYNESLPAGTTLILMFDGTQWLVCANSNLSQFARIAEKLQTARKLKVALGSTADATFDGSADQTAIPISGTLPVANGGTGVTTVAEIKTLLGLQNGASAVFSLSGSTLSITF